MLLPQLQPPLRAALASIARSGQSSGSGQAQCLAEAFAQLSIASTKRASHPSFVFKRHASHAQQATVSKGKDGPGKRLGAKRSGEQYVIPGNIIFRQRGTHWFAGENCGVGRDHTIYALQPGYVKYYKDPSLHPDRKYIGVSLKKDDVLPTPPNAMRRRRLGMVASIMEEEPEIAPSLSEAVKNAVEEVAKKRTKKQQKIFDRGDEGRVLTLKKGYMYRESNWEIGRAAERAQVKVREFKPRDRWAAWRKRAARKEKAVEMRTLGRNIRKA